MQRLEEIFYNQEREIEISKVILKPLCEASPKPINLANLVMVHSQKIEATRTLLWKSETLDFYGLLIKLRDSGYIEFLESGELSVDIVIGKTELRMPPEAKDFFTRNYLERPLEAN